MKKNFNLLLLLIIFSLSFVSSATVIENFPQGYTIVESQQITLRAGEDFIYHFFVLNASTGKGVNSSLINCTFVLADSQGNILSIINPIWNSSRYWNVDINGSIFNNIGYYKYGLRCEDGAGGALTGNLEVNHSGYTTSSSQGILSIGILLSILLIMLFFGWLSFKFIDKNETFGFGLFFLVISLILSLYALFLGYILSRDYLFTSISDVQEKIFISGLLGLSAIMLIAFTFLIVKVVNQLKVKNTEKKYGKGYNQKSKTYDY